MSFKEDLSEALVKAVGFYNAGSTPDEAIVKSAQEMNFNLDQTDRLVEKFNTARTINYFEKNPSDRTQNFPLASKEKVASIIRGEDGEVKKASADEDGYHDYTCYDAKESDYFAPEQEKQAESVDFDAPSAKGYSYDTLCGIVTKRAELMKQHARKLRDSASMVRDTVMTELSKIASKVGSGYDPDERLALFKAACHGNPLLDSVVSLSPKWVQKRASEHEGRISRMNVVDLGDMQGLADELEYLKGASEKADALDKKAEAVERDRAGMLDRLVKVSGVAGAPFYSPSSMGGSASGASGGSDGGKKSKRYQDASDFLMLGTNSMDNGDPSEKVVKGVGSTAKSILTGVTPKGLSEYIGEGLLGSSDEIAEALAPKKKKDTSIKDHIDNLRRSTILQDLYDNDPILSEADPKDLANAYASIIQSSPEVSLNKEVVRAILRQSVNAMAISPFDAKQWADLENVLGKNKALKSGKVEK